MSFPKLNHELVELVNRPRPVPGRLRPARRLAVLLLIVEQCRAEKASIEQVQILDWALRTDETRQHFLEYLNGTRPPNEAIVRFDPCLARAMRFAMAEGLLESNEVLEQDLTQGLLARQGQPADYRVQLTSRGRLALYSIKEQTNALTVEKAFFTMLDSKITHKQVIALYSWSL